MRFRLSELCLGTALSAVLSTSAWAGPALDDAQPGATSADPAATASATGEPPADVVEYGVALRLRSVHVPKSIVELFVDRAAGGASNVGLGVDLIRRRGTVEVQLGIEFEHITPTSGVWINKGDNIASGAEADFILPPEDDPLGWLSIEFTFLNHAVINKYVAFRYGGGAGLGIITGNLYRYDVICAPGSTNNNPEPGCRPAGTGFDTSKYNGGGSPGGNGTGQRVKYDLPPVFPVINAIIGVQFRPTDKLVINLEGGIRTMPFFGTSVGYFF